MWFHRSDEKRQRHRADFNLDNHRPALLRVQTRLSVKQTIKLRWIGAALMILTALLSTGILLWVGMQSLERFLFKQNDLFRIRDFKIECTGEVITPKHVMDYAQLAECDNLFAVNISEKREYLLKTVPRLKAVDISRRLPGVLAITAQERIPVARLDLNGYYMTVDREGYILGASSSSPHLPIISGHGMSGIRPGVQLTGTPVMNALEVLDVCATSQIKELLKVVRIDMRHGEAVELNLPEGERVKLSWQHMGMRDSLSRERLEQKLVKLAEILKAAAARGKRISSIDMTLENNFPVPEYY